MKKFGKSVLKEKPTHKAKVEEAEMKQLESDAEEMVKDDEKTKAKDTMKIKGDMPSEKQKDKPTVDFSAIAEDKDEDKKQKEPKIPVPGKHRKKPIDIHEVVDFSDTKGSAIPKEI